MAKLTKRQKALAGKVESTRLYPARQRDRAREGMCHRQVR